MDDRHAMPLYLLPLNEMLRPNKANEEKDIFLGAVDGQIECRCLPITIIKAIFKALAEFGCLVYNYKEYDLDLLYMKRTLR